MMTYGEVCQLLARKFHHPKRPMPIEIFESDGNVISTIFIAKK
jgi:hypothetical protein